MNVIFIPYCSFATSGLSLLYVCEQATNEEVWSVHEGKHLSTEGEGDRDDKEHEEHHLCYEQEEDLRGSMVSYVRCRFNGS